MTFAVFSAQFFVPFYTTNQLLFEQGVSYIGMLAAIKTFSIMNILIGQTLSYSRKAKLIIYILGAAVISFLLFMNYYQKRMYRETINNGRNIRAAIINIDCTNGKGKSRLYFKNEINEVQHVNVSYTECQAFHRGDSISVYVSK